MAAPTKRKPKKKKKAKKIVTAEELAKRSHIREIRSIFRNAGFTRVGNAVSKEFSFRGRTGEIDDVFVFENIVVVAEYTTHKSSYLSTHLLKKKVLFDLIHSNPADFIEFFEAECEAFKQSRDDRFLPSQCHVILLYASKEQIEEEHKAQLKYAIFLDYPVVKYFEHVSRSIKLSSRFEVFAFLKLKFDEIGTSVFKPGADFRNYDGTLLPESHSNFPSNYNVVSFYIDPESLLPMAYVLRRDSWHDENDLYQRMISTKKINSIRRYLNTNKRVFVNNIIVTLPKETKLLRAGKETDAKTITKAEAITIQIPAGFNIVGLIDGQHRVFAYHEGGIYDDKIEQLRRMQNLLATGIIYPAGVSAKERTRFESKLFLEINTTQANASSGLKQAIGLMLKPFSAESIARAVLNRLNSQGPLGDLFELRFYESDKIKTTSIVSYALKPLVKLSGTDSLFALWTNSRKSELPDEKNNELLEEYIGFCSSALNVFLGAVKATTSDSQWTTERSVKNKVLSTTAINGLIICFRQLIDAGKTGDFNSYKKRLTGLSSFNFGKFKSSQYGAMSREVYSRYFEGK